MDIYLEMHPAEWGLEELEKSRTRVDTSMFYRSLLRVPMLKKRRWIKDVWRAYNSIHARRDFIPSSKTIVRSILKGYV